ncbi:MAG: hypothetical protein RLY66_442 [Candidatus Parcubacteria bacterium]|jgi:hypothetical protein
MITRSNKKSGLILVDILLALALGTVFVASIAQASSSARDMFETAREREYALNLYEEHKSEFEDMMPHESRSISISPSISFGTTTIDALARWFGNNRIETDISLEVDSPYMNRVGPIVFNAVRAYPFESMEEIRGTPLCTVNFSSTNPVGSYGFQHPALKPFVASIVPITLPIDPLLPLTDIEVRNGVAYISTDSSVAGDSDLLTADIRDHDNPTVISSINTGPGIASIALVKDKIFAAAASTAAQLHVIRFNSLATPILEYKYQVPLPYATATPPVASSIFYNNGLIYLGTEKWIGEEFSIIDVAGSTTPHRIGGLEIGSKVTDIFVRQGNAYLATAGREQLISVDISEPSTPLITGEFELSGWERQEGKSATSFEDSIFLGRTSGGFNIKNDHELFAGLVPSIEHPTPSLNMSVDVVGGIYGIIVDRFHLYAISRAVGKELQVFNYSMSATSSTAFPLPSTPRAMTCDRNRIYILASTAPIIYEVTFK